MSRYGKNALPRNLSQHRPMKPHFPPFIALFVVATLAQAAALAQPRESGPRGPAERPPAVETPRKPVATPQTAAAAPPPAPIPAPPPTVDAPPSDPTQPRQPLLSVYSLAKGAKGAELPVLAIKGRILGPSGAAALLSIDDQSAPVLVRDGVTVPLPGLKYAGMQLEISKVDEAGVHLTLTRPGQEGAAGLALVVY